jgi:Acetone carboxylase gamma subunit
MKIDDNIQITDDGIVTCAHCATALGEAGAQPLAHAIVRERPPVEAGPGIRADPATFTERPVTLRQLFCPQCLVLLATEIVPADEPSFRSWSVTG